MLGLKLIHGIMTRSHISSGVSYIYYLFAFAQCLILYRYVIYELTTLLCDLFEVFFYHILP